VAYASLPRERRRKLHECTAQALEALYANQLEEHYGALAHHYHQSGNTEKAVTSLQRAGAQAVQRSAYVEAVEHCTTGLEMLTSLQDTPERARQELDVQLLLGRALGITKGLGALEVGQAYARARKLCQQVGDMSQLFVVLGGLRGFYTNRGELQTARELQEQRLALAQRQHDAARLMEAHVGMGELLHFLGEFVPARAHLEQALAFAGPQQDRTLTFRTGHDMKVLCLGYLARTLSRLGYPDQTLMRSHEMLAYAQELVHAFSLMRALLYAALIHRWRREWSTSQERAEAALAIAIEHGFGHHVGPVTFNRGSALAAQGQIEVGLAQMYQGFTAIRAAGTRVELSAWLARLAEAHGQVGQAEEGLSLLPEALAWLDTTGERAFEADVHRIKGELLLRQVVPDESQAEACFQQALDVARRQQAKTLELHAAMSLSRLWQRQGKRAEAHELLAGIYGWFTEGFDTADLQDAKALLDALI
jgi:predicted ATPase